MRTAFGGGAAMTTFHFRIFVLLSILLTAANAQLGFNFQDLIFRDFGETDSGASLFVVSATGIALGLILLLHLTLFFFWNPARYIYGLLLILWIPVAYTGNQPGVPELIGPLYVGTMICSALVGGVIFGMAFTGPVGERFGRT